MSSSDFSIMQSLLTREFTDFIVDIIIIIPNNLTGAFLTGVYTSLSFIRKEFQ
jgi:hypothetical protein